ncbi:bifunctional metallophosphatase/5'-nucleotidase [Microbacterium sp. NPDC055910]|uniref:bifunctional metallophosphatase/5'-nucleotidase n=1 Tax=Microbacterium sp. NPDC055910 TaxID=3345659 RepID=UPI0035D9328A
MRNRSQPGRAASRRRLAVGAALTAAVLGAGAFVAVPAQAADPVTVNLVTMNDFHGRIAASAPAGGAAALATAVTSFREANDNTIFAAAGDLIGASTFESFIQQDLPTIQALNAAGLDVSAAGNHEFDGGWADLRDRVQSAADWEYISANVWDTETDDLALAPYWVRAVDGVSVGFIGAVTEDLPSLVNPAGIATLDVLPIVSSVNAVADDLSDGDPSNGEADVIVLLVHEGAEDTSYETATDPTTNFGAIVNGVNSEVNAIVSGHTHLAYSHQVPYAGDAGLRPVISSGQYGEKFSNMVITIDPDSKTVQSMDNTVYSMYLEGGVAAYAPDPTVQAIVDQAVIDAGPLGAAPLGTLSADINRAKLANGTTENRGAESTLGNFVADAQLWAVQRTDPTAQIAFMNPGGLRTDMTYAPDGVLTYREAASVQPFANTLVALTLTGAQLTTLLEQQWQPAGATRPFLKLGVSKGLTYTFDSTAAAGSRVANAQFDGAPIDPAGEYRVVANSFLAAGGDNFAAFTQGTAKADTGQADLAAMVDYMAFVGTASPDYAQRSIGLVLSAPPAGGYTAGSTIDISLSSLDFSTTEPKADTVSVAIDGTVVGTAPVDSTVGNEVLDVTGTANLSVTVPTGVSGAVALTITTLAGTAIEVPITIAEPVAKSATITLGVPSKILAKHGTKIQYNVAVIAAKGTPTGEVAIFDGNRRIATATLTAKDRGVVSVTLPTLSRGLHLLSATYAGSDAHDGSKSFRFPVLVW